MGKSKVLWLAGIAVQLAIAQAALAFTQVIVFGDSLSDDGNVAHRVRNTFGFSYPSSNPLFNYSDYRFTNDNHTDPGSTIYRGTWHEQLERDFLHLTVARNSLDGGTDYAFGGATTKDGVQQRTVVNNPFPFSGGDYSITIDNVGKQIADYAATHTIDPNALYVIWGGGNDLFDDYSAANVTATASRVGVLIQRLANVGARNFLVPNVPPLGAVPNSFGDPNRVTGLDFASAKYRNQLYGVIAGTQSTLASQGKTIQVYILDALMNGIRVLAQPGRYGFVNVTDPAQGESVNPDQFLFWDDIHPTAAGHHQIANEAFRLLNGQIGPLGRATNISTRGFVGTSENVLIAGFIINGFRPKPLIVRALGPTLAASGVSGVLADPRITIYNSNHAVVASNDNWRQTQEAQIAASGFAPSNDSEAAIMVMLPPGSYTSIVSGNNGGTGIALAEVYDLSPEAAGTFSNLSTRAFVGTGQNVLIGGLIVGSGEPPVVVVRAIGPTLANAGISRPLNDPTLELHDANGALLAFDDNWHDAAATAIKATLLPPSDGRESVIVRSLPAGNYTAVVRGKNGTTGVALVEAYRLQ